MSNALIKDAGASGNPDADLPGCHAYREGENDRSLTISDTKTRPLNRRRPSERVPAIQINLALPNARIIHARRDPLDTCFSSFSKLFAGDHPYSYDLTELGHVYRNYEALMAHWRRVLPQGVLLEVQYEEMVANLEGQARRMVAHCGLDWDDRCLSFHPTKRSVQTLSTIDVRQPIYQSSVGR
jgi:hypothetical protein